MLQPESDLNIMKDLYLEIRAFLDAWRRHVPNTHTHIKTHRRLCECVFLRIRSASQQPVIVLWLISCLASFFFFFSSLSFSVFHLFLPLAVYAVGFYVGKVSD